MKHFRLSPISRQLIIFLLLVALLWNGEPRVGPDGLVQAEFEDYETNMYSHGAGPKTGWYIDLHLIPRHDNSNELKVSWLQDALLVSCTAIQRPPWALEVLEKAPWLKKVLPKRLAVGGHTLVVRIKIQDWERLEEAKRNGAEFLITKVPIRFVGTGRRRD